MNRSTLMFVCHIFIVVFIHALLLLCSAFRIYYLSIYFLLLSKDAKGKFVVSSLSARKILQSDVLLQSVMAVVVFFTETSSTPNWTPHIVN